MERNLPNSVKLQKPITVKNKIKTTELIKVAPFRKEVRKTKPHKHNNYLEVIYLSKGRGTHTIDHSQFPIEAPTVFCVRQEQVHHWEITAEPDGYVLLLRKGFVEKSLDGALKNLISRLSALNCLHLEENDTIETLFQLLVREADFVVIEGLLKALLTKILSIAKPIVLKKHQTNDLILLFRELLSETDSLRNQVAYYAEKLNTTPQNLNAVCRKVLNQQASQILAEYIINEAKRLLVYTDKNVSQIASRLNFNDTSHFTKYFKRYTNVTPRAFRSTNATYHIFK